MFVDSGGGVGSGVRGGGGGSVGDVGVGIGGAAGSVDADVDVAGLALARFQGATVMEPEQSSINKSVDAHATVMKELAEMRWAR